MNIGELKKILEQYPDSVDILVLHKLRLNGSGRLLEVENIHESFNQDNNKISLVIETNNLSLE